MIMKFAHLPVKTKKTIRDIGWVISDSNDVIANDAQYIIDIGTTVIDRQELKVLMKNKKIPFYFI